MSTHEDRDYEVGYGKPPQATRFKKGQSGNPKGRPKGAKGFKASLKRELESKVTVREGNREIRISKAEATAKRLVALALKGDMKAISMLAGFDKDLADQIAIGEADMDEVGMAEPVDYDILRDFFSERLERDDTDKGEEAFNDGA